MILLRDQAAMDALVWGEPSPEPRQCPDCDGWGTITFAGEGRLGTDIEAPCETCDGRGVVDD
jgi:DnaJ-class molecular chaperone